MKSPIERAAQRIANNAALQINREAQDIELLKQEPLIKYTAQELLEQVIKLLEAKV
jgi:hypothetical protein